MRGWLSGYKRYGLVLPAEVEVRQLGAIVKGIAGMIAISLLDKVWQTLQGGRSLMVGMFLAAAAVFLSEYLLQLVFPPRITSAPWLERPERTENPSSKL